MYLCLTGLIILLVVVLCINHWPIMQEPGIRFHVETMHRHKRLNKRPIKAALKCASRVAPPSGHFMNQQNPWQDDRFTSQSSIQMVAHAYSKSTSSHQITEVSSCVEVVGKTSHTILPLSTQQWWVPGGMKTGKIVNGISCRICTQLSPEEMNRCKREFQYHWCKLSSLLNSRGFQTINLYIYIYI